MNPFASLLVPLDSSRAAARCLGCATWLATTLHAKLHILSATSQPLPAREELIRLRVPEEYWQHVVLHQAPQFPEDAILAVAAEHNVNLIVMSAQGEAAERTPEAEAAQQAPAPLAVGHVTCAVIERSSIPVLLLPSGYSEALPWKHVLVPLSGEAEADEVLALAVKLANALSLEVHVLHVLERSDRECGLATSARYADAMHHEYPQRLAELVRRALLTLTPEECHCIRDVALSRGVVTSELLDQMERKHVDLLVIGWHGRFMEGHADVLKSLLKVIDCPMLLVKSARRAPFRLKVGEEIE